MMGVNLMVEILLFQHHDCERRTEIADQHTVRYIPLWSTSCM